jgi:O-antigen biosynthesis protein
LEKIDKGLFRITSYVADQAGCANIRVIIPFILLNQLHIKNFLFQAYFNNMFTRDMMYYKNSSIIQFQRAATKDHLEYFELVRKKIKLMTRSGLVYEIDDDLLNIPNWNFAKGYYKDYTPYITDMLSKADGLTVSTERLKTLYSKYNNNIQVVPNHLPRFSWGVVSFSGRETNRPRIIYPCSSNHFSTNPQIKGGDMGDTLLKFIRKTTEDYEWIFIGGCPHELLDLVKMGKVTRHMWYSVYEYPRFLKSLKSDIGIAPLDLNVFNTSKSDIKTLEFTALGLPGVFTKIDPYDKMVLQAADEDEFISHIESLRDINKRHEVWSATQSMLAGRMFWEDNNYRNLKNFVKSYLAIIKKEADLH